MQLMFDIYNACVGQQTVHEKMPTHYLISDISCGYIFYKQFFIVCYQLNMLYNIKTTVYSAKNQKAFVQSQNLLSENKFSRGKYFKQFKKPEK